MGRLGVVGSGTMGASIAALAIASGLDTTLLSRGDGEAARTRVGEVLARYRPETLAEAKARLHTCREPSGLRGVDAVIEAIPEIPTLKRDLFMELDLVLDGSAVLLSNTSVLGAEIFAFVSEDRLPKTAVLHFFHPVFRMELAEVNAHRATSQATVDAAEELAIRMGRRPLRIAGVPGGVVSRVVLAAINEAARLADGSGLTPEDIDRALEMGAHYPLGPLRLADLVGLDIVLDNLTALSLHEGDLFRPATALARLVEQGRLGRKTGHGFYFYAREVAKHG